MTTLPTIRTKRGAVLDLEGVRHQLELPLHISDWSHEVVQALFDSLKAALSVPYEGSVREVREAIGVIEDSPG